MKKLVYRALLLTSSLTIILALSGHAQEPDAPDRGAYIAVVAGCTECHTAEGGQPFSGRSFDLNGQTIYAPNLTPAENALAGWLADEIETAIRTGLRPDGSQLHPVMPYLSYNQMADEDMDALVSYLQGLDPIETGPQPTNDLSGVTLPPTPDAPDTITAPAVTDQLAYGAYLSDAVLACNACHTPTLADGTPDESLIMAGGTAFSGEWGTVYASNLTPDQIDGIGSFSDDEVLLPMIAGQHSTRRPLYAMPWRSYAFLTGSDAQAVIAYLRTLRPIGNQVPTAELNEGYEDITRLRSGEVNTGGIITTIFIAAIVIGAVAWVTYRQYQNAQRVKNTDWEAHFKEVLNESRQEDRVSGKRMPEPGDEPPDA